MLQDTDILFVTTPSTFISYNATRVQAAVQQFPLLSYLTLAAAARQRGYRVAVLDLTLKADPYNKLQERVEELKPRFVGITSTTPLFFEVAELSRRIRKSLGREVTLIYGGPHATALPEESLKSSEFDIVVFGEGEETLCEILSGRPLPEIAGIHYKENDQIRSLPSRPFIKDLDSLPFPAIDLYNLSAYKCSSLVARRWPLSQIETSRGCPSRCTFCSKSISATLFRKKSPERVIEEIKHFLKMGVRELRVIDDQFATDLNRAKKICELILRQGLDFSWNLAAGVRADNVDLEFLKLAKRAGCYQVGIGFESGDNQSLKSINKHLTTEQSIKAMELVRKSGLESVGFFMLGLPADSEESLKKTTKLAVKLMPDYAKVTITTPFPGSVLFEDYERRGLILTRDWTLYGLHNTVPVYQHPNLSHQTLVKYYNKFYSRFYLNPRYLAIRTIKSVRNRTLLRDIGYALRTLWPRLFPVADSRRAVASGPLHRIRKRRTG